MNLCRSRDSTVGIATSYGLDNRGVGVQDSVGLRTFSSPVSWPDLGPTQPPIQWIPGVLSLEIKQPGSEAESSHPSNAEV
jgi:hypothetical protein